MRPHFYLFLFVLEDFSMPKESDFQLKLRKEIENRFEGSIVTKLDAGNIQGIPDLLVLYKDKWAALECKRKSNANKQCNQDYYVDILDSMSFARFICPENKESVLNEMERSFKSDRTTRISKSKQHALD